MLVVWIISLARTHNVTLCCSKPTVWQWRVHSWYLASSDLFDFSHKRVRAMQNTSAAYVLKSERMTGRRRNDKLNRRSVWKRWRKTGVHCFVFSFALKLLFARKVEKVFFNQEFKLQRNYSEVNFRLRQASKVRSVTSTIQPVLEMIKHHYLNNVLAVQVSSHYCITCFLYWVNMVFG